jgi:hypothetical protein
MAGDYQSLRNVLIMGGAEIDTLDILVNSPNAEVRKDSVLPDEKSSSERPKSQSKQYVNSTTKAHVSHTQNLSRITSTPTDSHDRTTSNGHGQPRQSTAWRPITYDISMPNEAMDNCDDDEILAGNSPAAGGHDSSSSAQSQGTLFFSGLSERTTYQDLMSVIKGGKIVSSVLRNNGALVTFSTGAAEFLAWSKRNDIYLQGKRVSSVHHNA